MEYIRCPLFIALASPWWCLECFTFYTQYKAYSIKIRLPLLDICLRGWVVGNAAAWSQWLAGHMGVNSGSCSVEKASRREQLLSTYLSFVLSALSAYALPVLLECCVATVILCWCSVAHICIIVLQWSWKNSLCVCVCVCVCVCPPLIQCDLETLR